MMIIKRKCLFRSIKYPYNIFINNNDYTKHDATNIFSRTTSIASSSSSLMFSSQSINTRKSLALSVHFYQPELGMKEYEILSRASAFLIAVDAKDPEVDDKNDDSNNNNKNDPFHHLKVSEKRQYEREYKLNHHSMSPVSGPNNRKLIDLNWLEFVPKEVRPQVHIVCSSHVVSPFLWKEYYSHEWLNHVKQEHLVYTLEVIDEVIDDEEDKEEVKAKTNSKTTTSTIAKFAVNNSKPFHHPEGRDVSLLHFKDEKSSLKLLKSLDVELLYLRSPDKMYTKGESMYFDGYVVQERNIVDDPKKFNTNNNDKNKNNNEDSSSSDDEDENDDNNDTNEDNRIFYPYKDNGQLAFHTDDRFFATTTQPLPEGLCGAPVLDTDGECCGTVEGIVPVTHKNPNLAGSAAFIPSYIMKEFIDYVERGLLEQIMPKDLFNMVCTAKKTNSIGGGTYQADGKGTYTKETNWEDAYDIAIASLKKRYQPEEVDAILNAINRERDEVLDELNKSSKSSNQDDNEDGENNVDDDIDLNEIMYRVRSKTLQIRELVKDQYMKQLDNEETLNDNDNNTNKPR